jgi:hypothetical protein
MLKRDYQTLDAIVVIGSLCIVGLAIAGLMIRIVPSDNLPIIAGLLGTMLGTVIGGYAGFRWGASVGNKNQGDETE